MNIKKEGHVYLVESSSKKGHFYKVDVIKRTCDCPAYRFRYSKKGLLCKHIEQALLYDERYGKKDLSAIIGFLRKNAPVDSVKLIEMFSEEGVNELIEKGEITERHGRIWLLE
jgi:hypothetical protein